MNAPAAYLPRAHTNDRRVYPPRWHSRYAAATRVRRTMESTARKYFPSHPNATLVDFGCGDMPYRHLIDPFVTNYVGVDLPGNPKAEFHLHPDGTTSVPDAFADILLSTQVLEHVPEPEQHLSEARRMLRPGGLLALSTHGYWSYHPDPTDFHRWTGPGLQRLVEKTGFATVELVGLLGLLPAGLQLASDGLIRKVCPKPLRRYLGPPFALLTQSPMIWMDRLHTDAQRAQDAAAFMIVARKT